MKRCIKCFIILFADWIKQLYWEQVVGFAISGLLGIALTINLFITTDTVPATSSDYVQLEKLTNVIQQNIDLLLEPDRNIDSEIITVTFENDECKVITEYDKNFEVLSTSKKDKSMFWLLALVFSLIVGGLVVWFFGFVFTLVILELKFKFQKN